MAKIKKIQAYEIIDSRGYPTLEGRLTLDNNIEVYSSVPSGTSVGSHEAYELRDQDHKRFLGYGVSRAASFVNELISPKLIGVEVTKNIEIDQWLIKADGTKNKTKLGANTILLISQLTARAAAKSLGIPLFQYLNLLYEKSHKEKIKLEKIPTPIFNIINGGRHANNNLEIQEFQIVPSSNFNFDRSYQTGVEIFHRLKQNILYRTTYVASGEEGGYTPSLISNTDALEILIETINNVGLKPGLDIFLGMDLAANFFYKNSLYNIKDLPHPVKADQFIDFLLNIIKKYYILILEDPLYEDSWEDWIKLSDLISKEIYLVGDDLITTNEERLSKAIKSNACNAVIIKPNQIGTLTETFKVIYLAKKNNITIIVSHRSGETNDSFIADFAVGVQADFVKFGAPSRGERVAKYNRLWQIEREELK